MLFLYVNSYMLISYAESYIVSIYDITYRHPMDYPVHFAHQLKSHVRSLRRAQGLTQARLGQLVGLPQSRIAEFEADPSAARVELLFRVLAALDAQMLVRTKAGSEAEIPAAGPEAAVPGANATPSVPNQPGDSW
jgi:HTH-type transcriptional regulator / antitoxin HipB